jgi:hypothetical protein
MEKAVDRHQDLLDSRLFSRPRQKVHAQQFHAAPPRALRLHHPRGPLMPVNPEENLQVREPILKPIARYCNPLVSVTLLSRFTLLTMTWCCVYLSQK